MFDSKHVTHPSVFITPSHEVVRQNVELLQSIQGGVQAVQAVESGNKKKPSEQSLQVVASIQLVQYCTQGMQDSWSLDSM